jgi:cholera toxin transcriptional activator
MNMLDEDLASDTVAPPSCLTIKTGRADCLAHFYPSLYQLTLVTNGVEEKVDLGFSGSRLLERLAQIPGDVVAREELISHAWSGRVVGQGSLNQQIYTLRQVLGDERDRTIIQTLPRRGYLLNPQSLITPESLPADVQSQVTPAQPQANAQLANSPTPEEPVRAPQSGRYRNRGLMVLSLMAWMAVFFFGYFAGSTGPGSMHGDAMQSGKLMVSYVDQHPEQVERLRSQTQRLTTRLEQLADQHTRLFVSLRGEFYEFVCMQANGRARSVAIHHSQLNQVADEQLQWCLPQINIL